jgi:murein DD-endopeptidase MepM/ murein hydrolase activator NlpD
MLSLLLAITAIQDFVMPPRAASALVIEQITLAPIYATDFTCSEHFAGQLEYAGDALGADCVITGGVTRESGFSSPYRSDGRANEDWYGWNSEVLAPVSGTVAGVIRNPITNTPGSMGRPPASMVQIRTAEGVVVVLAHLNDIAVAKDEPVTVGQVISRVGNNGVSRSPHVHVGAWREASSEPLQIRWDQVAMARQR